jgi:hypothetical protein
LNGLEQGVLRRQIRGQTNGQQLFTGVTLRHPICRRIGLDYSSVSGGKDQRDHIGGSTRIRGLPHDRVDSRSGFM